MPVRPFDAYELGRRGEELGLEAILTTFDDVEFRGCIEYVETDFVIVGGYGFPLEDVSSLELDYES